MAPLLRLVAVLAVALAAYLGLFALVVHKPMTVDVIGEMMAGKRAYAARAPSPKLLIFAGSNARVSHRCETIERRLGIPCANLGIGRGIGLDYELDFYKSALHPGDVLYLPLEYDEYLVTATQMMTGPDGTLMLQQHPAELFRRGWERTLRAAFAFDLPYAISGVVEMGLEAAGFRRRFGVDTLTKEGDESGHTLAKAAAFRSYVEAAKVVLPTAEAFARPSHAKEVLARFFAWAKAHQVLVVGGLPTTFDDVPIPAGLIPELREFYESAGQDFLVLPGRSQYPRRCFYDTPWHLAEPFQIEHSARLADAIRPLLERRGVFARD